MVDFQLLRFHYVRPSMPQDCSQMLRLACENPRLIRPAGITPLLEQRL
jgi:hypothetical protein